MVAIEDNLHHIGELLRQNGYQTVGMTDQDLQRSAAVIISGADQNVLGIHDSTTKATVINAHGMTAEDVLRELNAHT